MMHLLQRALAIVAAAAALPAFCAYVFNTIDYPGAVMTDVRGLNASGRIVGAASFDGTTFFAFTYAGGAFTPLPPPPVGTTFASGINDTGTIVGAAFDGTVSRGFVLNGAIYNFFSRPGWTHAEFRAISNSGLITGWSWEVDAGGNLTAAAGFIYDVVAAVYTDISIGGSNFLIAQGLNAAGQAVGSVFLSDGQHGWLREPTGTVSLFRIAGGYTRARGINDAGLITGFARSADGAEHAFVASSAGYQLLDVPGASTAFGFGTIGEGINDSGQVSGLWHDASGATRGFIATPAALPTGTTSGGAYTFAVDVVANVPIFIDPPVAVGYDYAIGRGDPRIASTRLPIGVGDSIYSIKVGGRKFTVAGGELFDFRAHGFPQGVEGFRVGCIEVAAALDPANPQAFPTQLTFVASGQFTGTQAPRKRSSNARGNGNCDDD